MCAYLIGLSSASHEERGFLIDWLVIRHDETHGLVLGLSDPRHGVIWPVRQ